MSDRPGPETPLADAKDWLRDRVEQGETCPCCGQFTKVYKRKINAGMAQAMVLMYRHAGTGWLHKPTVLSGVGAGARDESLLRFWGLLEEEAELRPDGGRAGWWRVTEKGEDFLRGRIAVPKYGRFYAQRCLGFEGPDVTIHDSLGDRFDLGELMAGV